MQNSNLNLARKWRSKSFDQIIGQELSIRILKNGLYLNSFFPVYLFSGQRGCGKTTTARVFAAAINCFKLSDFQKDPKGTAIPCFECHSCIAMKAGSHPDFIEIDAASNTGVDNVRNIIEASSFMPLIGRKKIYLIDEAHMLSKAAFNAFLKILEEPPMGVLFILATTDVQKIIDTVRSRSFQLFFSSISLDVLVKHLEEICKGESIEYELEALKIIAKESQGSARDAINLLEQVRFANKVVDKNGVLSSLGHISEEKLILFLDFLINKRPQKDFIEFLDDINFYKYSAEHVFHKLLELLRLSLRIKYGVIPKDNLENIDVLIKSVSSSSLNNIIDALDNLCTNELLFLKTINKNLFLELICLKILSLQRVSIAPVVKPLVQTNFEIVESKNKLEQIKPIDLPTIKNIPATDSKLVNGDWNKFIESLSVLNDPLINSVFTQAQFISFNNRSNEVVISFSKKLIFFKDMLDNAQNFWMELLRKAYNQDVKLQITFNESIVEPKINGNTNNINTIPSNIVKPKDEMSVTNKQNLSEYKDDSKWEFANSLLKKFSGTITEIKEENNE